MKIRRYTALTLVAALVSATPVAAQTVYSGGTPNGTAGYDMFNDFRSADDFTFSTATAFDVIRFWGILPGGSTYTPTIFWQILSDAGGTPGASVSSGSALAAATLRTSIDFGFESWQFDLTVAPQLVDAGVYWLSLHDGGTGDITDSGLIWEMSDAGGSAPFATQFIPTEEWAAFDGNLAFELASTPVSTVPEPGVLALLATGLAGLGAVRRRRKASLPTQTH